MIIPIIDIISANKELRLRLAVQGFQGNGSCCCLRSSPCYRPRVKGVRWLMCSHTSCSVDRLVLPARQRASAQGPTTHRPALQKMLLSAGTNVGIHDTARKGGGRQESLGSPMLWKNQEFSQVFLLPHAVTIPCKYSCSCDHMSGFVRPPVNELNKEESP